MDSFLRWLGRHEGIGWAALLLGTAEAMAAFGIESAPRIALLVMGGVLIGGMGASMIVLQHRKHRVECLECTQSYHLHGKRGHNCQFTVAMLIRAKAPLESFVHSKVIAPGNIEHDSTTFCNLGPEGRRNPKPPSAFVLGREHMFATTHSGDGTTLRIVPPAPLKKGDQVEVVRKLHGTGCFSSEDEFVEKLVLFPTRKLRFELTFANGLRVANCWAARYDAGIPMEEGFETLTPVATPSGTTLSWEVSHVQPNQAYRVGWRWV
jgi:hypothetical protein